MPQPKNFVFRLIRSINDKLISKPFSDSYYEACLSSECRVIAEYLGTSLEEATMFSAIFILWMVNKSSWIDIEKIAKHLHCDVLDIYEKSITIQSLTIKKIIYVEGRDTSPGSKGDIIYGVSPWISKAILSDKEPTKPACDEHKKTFTDFVMDVTTICDDSRTTKNNIREDIVMLQTEDYENEYSEFREIQAIKQNIPLINHRTIIYNIMRVYIENDSTDLRIYDILCNVYGRRGRSVTETQMFVGGTHPLQNDGFVATKVNDFSKQPLKLTDKTKNLFPKHKDLFKDKNGSNNKGSNNKRGNRGRDFDSEPSPSLIDPCDIVQKNLYYGGETEQMLTSLANILQDDNYNNLCKKLSDKSMPSGVAVLLHGFPGTGKTEFVNQLAKATNRKIFKVDISKTKTMWFGESEKLIKKVFDDYRDCCDNEDIKPILLFNECDGVLSKRIEAGFSSCAQTENAIQNIILEEIEHLDGILFATTNLTTNLDAAFERRFLFKVFFEKPTVMAKTFIWQDNITYLTDDEATQLAEDFDFSGGEISNVARRVTIQELLKGCDRLPLSEIIKICKTEKLNNKSSCRPIGFTAANNFLHAV